MLYLNMAGADLLIKKYKSSVQDSFWNNYDLVLWDKSSSGYFDKSGMYHKNSWGIAKTFSVNNDGTWRLPKKYVKYFK